MQNGRDTGGFPTRITTSRSMHSCTGATICSQFAWLPVVTRRANMISRSIFPEGFSDPPETPVVCLSAPRSMGAVQLELSLPPVPAHGFDGLRGHNDQPGKAGLPL